MKKKTIKKALSELDEIRTAVAKGVLIGVFVSVFAEKLKELEKQIKDKRQRQIIMEIMKQGFGVSLELLMVQLDVDEKKMDWCALGVALNKAFLE